MSAYTDPSDSSRWVTAHTDSPAGLSPVRGWTESWSGSSGQQVSSRTVDGAALQLRSSQLRSLAPCAALPLQQQLLWTQEAYCKRPEFESHWDPFLAGPGLVGQVCWKVSVYRAVENNSPKCGRPALHGWGPGNVLMIDCSVKENSFLIPSWKEWSSLSSRIWDHSPALSWFSSELQYTEICRLTAVSIYPRVKNSVGTK